MLLPCSRRCCCYAAARILGTQYTKVEKNKKPKQWPSDEDPLSVAEASSSSGKSGQEVAPAVWNLVNKNSTKNNNKKSE